LTRHLHRSRFPAALEPDLAHLAMQGGGPLDTSFGMRVQGQQYPSGPPTSQVGLPIRSKGSGLDGQRGACWRAGAASGPWRCHRHSRTTTRACLPARPA